MQVQAFSPNFISYSRSFPSSDDTGLRSGVIAIAAARSAGRAAERPDPSDDAYATYVRDVGAQQRLSANDSSRIRASVIGAVRKSLPRLADPYTAQMTIKTVLDALARSPTFRDAVSFGLHHHGGRPLGEITYRSEYAHAPLYPFADAAFQNRSGGGFPIDTQRASAGGSGDRNDVRGGALVTHNMAAVDEAGRPYIDFTVAPNADSPYMPLWQEGLLHEIIHQITGALDPSSNEATTQGPTELLARRVAREIGLRVPSFSGYAAPERSAMLSQRDASALRDAIARNGSADGLMQRLELISEGRDASPDFRELRMTAAA